MRKFLPVFIIVGILTASAGLFFAIQYFSGEYLNKSSTAKETVTCRDVNTEHQITIQNNRMLPSFIEAQLCDSLVITNTDDALRQMSFGEHDKHIVYNGVSTTMLKKDQSYMITLNQLGSYIVHDHFDEGVAATFTVKD